MTCWCGYLPGAIVCIWSSWCHCIPKPHYLLPHLHPEWFYLSGDGLPKLSRNRPLIGCSSVVVHLLSHLPSRQCDSAIFSRGYNNEGKERIRRRCLCQYWTVSWVEWRSCGLCFRWRRENPVPTDQTHHRRRWRDRRRLNAARWLHPDDCSPAGSVHSPNTPSSTFHQQNSATTDQMDTQWHAEAARATISYINLVTGVSRLPVLLSLNVLLLWMESRLGRSTVEDRRPRNSCHRIHIGVRGCKSSPQCTSNIW